MSDFKQILSEAKRQIREVSVQEVRDKLNPDNGFTLLDVREGDEWEQGHLDKAISCHADSSKSKRTNAA